MKSLNLSIYYISKEAFEEQRKGESGECGIFLLRYKNVSKLFCLGHAISNSSKSTPCLKYRWQEPSSYYFLKSNTLMEEDDFVWLFPRWLEGWMSEPDRTVPCPARSCFPPTNAAWYRAPRRAYMHL